MTNLTLTPEERQQIEEALNDLRGRIPGDDYRSRAIAAEAIALLAALPQADDLEEMCARKDTAYLERNQVVAALAKCFPSGVARTAIEGWSEDWHGCVYIDLPTGQASWHFHDSQAYLFDGLPPYKGKWDGHDTPEKYRRLAALPVQGAQPPSPTVLDADAAVGTVASSGPNGNARTADNTKRWSWWQIAFNDGYARRKTSHMMTLPGYENGYYAGFRKREREDAVIAAQENHQ